MLFAKTIIKQEKKIIELNKENKALHEENKLLRNENEDSMFQKRHAKILAEDTLELLDLLQEINKKGNSEERKQKDRNMIINNLRKRNIEIIKELDVGKTF